MRALFDLCAIMALVVAVDAATASANVTARLDALEGEIAALKKQRVELLESNDRVWLLTSAFTILQMQVRLQSLLAWHGAMTSTPQQRENFGDFRGLAAFSATSSAMNRRLDLLCLR